MPQRRVCSTQSITPSLLPHYRPSRPSPPHLPFTSPSFPSPRPPSLHLALLPFTSPFTSPFPLALLHAFFLFTLYSMYCMIYSFIIVIAPYCYLLPLLLLLKTAPNHRSKTPSEHQANITSNRNSCQPTTTTITTTTTMVVVVVVLIAVVLI